MVSKPAAPRVLIIVQNLPVPFDRRVWLESLALRDAGYDVTVVCPQGRGTHSRQVVEAVTILAYRPYAPGGGALSYVAEYAYSFAATAYKVARARLGGRFDVVQACNPPEIFWPLARLLRAVDRTRFVFDHHDLSPELYRSRFPDGPGTPLRGLLALERSTFRAADRVISTNESYAAVARTRGGKRSDQVTVVRTGPDPEKLKPGSPYPARRRGRPHLVAYIGVMGPQDGVDQALRAADLVVHQFGRTDVSFTLIGSGDCWEELVAERDRLGLQDYVEMPGRLPDDDVIEVLSTADIGLSPDPKNPLNDVSTMNKTMEYMAFGMPVLAFDLLETRVSAGEAARYVPGDDVELYAKELLALLDDPSARATMGSCGRRRVEDELGWPHQRDSYVSVFDELTAAGTTP